jgi:hypothetical protein
MSDERVPSESRLTVYDPKGKALAEFSCQANRSWVLGGIGEARIAIANSTPRLTEQNVRFGNRVLIQNSRIGSWGGVIWTPRKWQGGSLQLTAYSPEYLLKLRRTSSSMLTGTAGSLFAQLLEIANARESLGLIYDTESFTGGASWEEPVHYDTCYDVLQRIQLRSGQEWEFRAEKTLGQLVFKGLWQVGPQPVLSGSLWEGLNLEDEARSILIEQGDIHNDIVVLAQGTNVETPGQATDAASIEKYLLSEGIFITEGATSGAAQYTAETLLARFKEPRRTFSLTATDTNNTFDFLRVGNFVKLYLYNHGFMPSGERGVQTTVRITQMAYDDMTNKVSLTVEE